MRGTNLLFALLIALATLPPAAQAQSVYYLLPDVVVEGWEDPSACLYVLVTGVEVGRNVKDCSEKNTIRVNATVAGRVVDAKIRFLVPNTSVQVQSGRLVGNMGMAPGPVPLPEGPPKKGPDRVQVESLEVVVYLHARFDDGCATVETWRRVVINEEEKNTGPTASLDPFCAPGVPRLQAVLDMLDDLAKELSAVAPDAGASLEGLLDRLPEQAPVDLGPTPDVTVDTQPEAGEDAGDVGADALAGLKANLSEPGLDGNVDGGVDGPGTDVRVHVDDDPPAPEALAMAPHEPLAPLAAQSVAAFVEPGSARPRVVEAPTSGAGTPSPGSPLPADPTVFTPQATGAPTARAPPPLEPGAGLAPMAAATAGATILGLVAWVLYQRIARAKALDHPARARLHDVCVAAAAPLGVSEIARRAELPTKAALYHLRYLVRAGLLREDRSPEGWSRFVVPGAAPAPATAPLDARVLGLLLERPGLSTREMAQEMGVKYGRMDRVLKDLLCDGHVESRVEEGRRAYFAVEP